ncbi:YheC/YheD family protein [Cohnella nanjingensis]|uniref:YheC/YheD family protein n=1 Tax=Cohnella nanjingensis TaxID=1387779 RepID=A0A7X0RVJ6_9BACL|nr:YheC/YheD family protein [Cohnella nanjingensis]MBB6674413.1 YheC/YheD family protein [Cohnella nanjingensis]
MPIRRVRSKWAKTDALLASPEMKEFVPVTRKFDLRTVREMLHQLGMVYVKPVHGTFGRGVIRVEYVAGLPSPYRFQSGERLYRFDTFDAMYAKLLQVKKPRDYLVQQGIELLRHDGRRFDFRIMVQHNPAGRWASTGIIGRLSHPRKIVTNYHSGGTPLPFEALMQEACAKNGADLGEYRERLRTLGVRVAKTLELRFPGLKEIGIDVAIDQEMKPWILEVNTLPDPYIFLRLRDRSVYRRIRAYAVAYGRFPKTARRRRIN